MNKRLVWLAPIALAVLLSGCSITLQVSQLAPNSILGNSVAFTIENRSGLFPDGHGTYHFNRDGMAFDANLIQARTWIYKREDHRSATLSLTFEPPGSTDLMVNCDLTFRDQDSGEYKCKYAQRTSTMVVDFIVKGSSDGTFRIRVIGQIGA